MSNGQENRARLVEQKIIDHTDCEECSEDYLFLMQDGNHEFSMGLRTILACLAFAEKEGAVPPLPVEWWWQVSTRYE